MAAFMSLHLVCKINNLALRRDHQLGWSSLLTMERRGILNYIAASRYVVTPESPTLKTMSTDNNSSGASSEPVHKRVGQENRFPSPHLYANDYCKKNEVQIKENCVA
ncbi:unnamed protein product [Dovyalis caffra]|uniref:Uncharacterized protein n=1 Tax=Dovyalis caffra TaxID=77055 RepID=A0AAV1QPN0_9ROSI|nr:unnamed protein product [Dovyalis caffra]